MSLVLVADDEPAVLEVLTQVVEDLGHDVIQARDGEEAWNLARARRPNLVVTDHMMPRLSGLDLCRRLRADEVLGRVPIILLSAVLPLGAPEAHAFLHKPFEITDFEGLVHKSLAETPRPKSLEGPSAMGALGNWAAQGFGASLAEARADVERLRSAGSADAGALESLGARLRSLEALTRDFQEAAHLAARTVTLKLETADLGAQLRQSLAAWKQRRPEARWALEQPEGKVELRYDAERFGRLLDALLGQAGRQGGEVRVALESTPSRVMIRVMDESPGLSDEELRALLEPFSGRGASGGLGLYIASELARLHGGALSVESHGKQGTTFSAILPRG